MRMMVLKKYGWLVLVCSVCFVACTKDTPTFPVEYELRFRNEWSAQTHPVDYPQDAHFTPFVTYSHKQDAKLFNTGLIASAGIKQYAETGIINTINEEIDIIRGGGRALDRDLGAADVYFYQTSAVRLGFNDESHYLTWLSRIAPSPDWFVAIDQFDMRPNGEWADSIVIYPDAYDAGTDNGQTFYSSDLPAEPRNAIDLIRSQPLADNGVVAPMASVTLVRLK